MGKGRAGNNRKEPTVCYGLGESLDRKQELWEKDMSFATDFMPVSYCTFGRRRSHTEAMNKEQLIASNLNLDISCHISYFYA